MLINFLVLMLAAVRNHYVSGHYAGDDGKMPSSRFFAKEKCYSCFTGKWHESCVLKNVVGGRLWVSFEPVK